MVSRSSVRDLSPHARDFWVDPMEDPDLAVSGHLSEGGAPKRIFLRAWLHWNNIPHLMVLAVWVGWFVATKVGC